MLSDVVVLFVGVGRDGGVHFGESAAEHTCHAYHKRLHYKRPHETQHPIPQCHQVSGMHNLASVMIGSFSICRIFHLIFIARSESLFYFVIRKLFSNKSHEYSEKTVLVVFDISEKVFEKKSHFIEILSESPTRSDASVGFRYTNLVV